MKQAWPALESQLYAQFLKQRSQLYPVGQSWFRRESRKLYARLYPEKPFFHCSRGWFLGFTKRWSISRRRITKQATKTPSDELQVVNSFLRFIRRVSFQYNYPASRIMNMDETPIPFEYLDRYTYSQKGAKTVSTRSLRSGWGKRQATLILYIFADGIKRLLLKLIFHGTEDGTIAAKESQFYSPGVTVEYNPKAYNNKQLIMKWLDDEVAPYCQPQPQGPFLMVLDQASFHRTKPILDWLRGHSITPGVVPSGLTSLLQPLDTAVNKVFKQHLKKYTEELTFEASDKLSDDLSKWTLSQRRILTTRAVALAWDELNSKLIIQSFQECGIGLRPDGSEDHLVKIKDLPQVSWDGWDTEVADGIKIEDIIQKYDEEELPDGDGDIFEAGESDTLQGLYEGMTIKLLKAALQVRGLTQSGRKAVLVERLCADDEAARVRRQPGATRSTPFMVYEDTPNASIPASIPASTPSQFCIGGVSLLNDENVDPGYYSQQK